MRKILLSAFTVIAFSALASAQSNVIKTKPLGLIFSNFNLTYEAVISSSVSLNLSANYQYRLLFFDVNAVGVGVGCRYFFTHEKKPVPAGFYLMPQVVLSYGNIGKDNYNITGFGAEVGYQFVWESGFVLDLGFGPMYRNVNTDAKEGSFNKDILAVWFVYRPTLTIAVGMAF